MDVPFLQTHLNSAVALVRQRCNWLCADAVESRALVSLERRLRMHLHVLANTIDDQEAEPDSLYETVVWIARRLQCNKTEQRELAAQSACNWLKDRDSPRAEGACLGLLLYRTRETDEAIRQTYQAEPDLRATLIYIWETQGVPIPQGLLNQGELHSFAPELQTAVLTFASNQANTGLDVFRHYYQPLLSSPKQLPHTSAVLTAAIRGGLLHGDTDAIAALRRAIELQTEAYDLGKLLKLAALSGAPDFHPVLTQHAQSTPEVGYSLLALWGHRQAIYDLVDGLKDPRASAHAADAWAWLTGQKLPFKPRLSLVGEEATEQENTENDDVIADLDVARQWWESRHSIWPEGQRWILGQPMSFEALCTLAGLHVGKYGNDILDLLGVRMASPLGVATQRWFSERLEKLAELDGATKTVAQEPVNGLSAGGSMHA